MGVFLAPRPVRNGLVIHIDANNEKSFVSGSTDAFGLSGTIFTGSLAFEPAAGSQIENSNIRVFTHDGTTGAEINFGIGSDVFPFYEFTFEMAFKSMGTVATTGTEPGLIGFTYGIWIHFQPDGDLETNIWDGATGNSSVVTDPGYLGSDEWHILQWKNDGFSSSLYVDNQLIDGPTAQLWTGSTDWPTNGLNIGRDNNNNYYYFTGSIGYFKFYDRFLSNGELTQNYNSMRGRYNL